MVEIEMTVSKRKLVSGFPETSTEFYRLAFLSYIRKCTIKIKDFVAGLLCHNLADSCFCTRDSVIFRF